ncbi:MAG: Signal peptidase I [Alphaproteobacteria bacterium MarineAlpha3_Bin5]|nr:signal peptidase I [Magnetovibrio sp.]PPR79021.1 MAG: Signal peptidase I [Alphaproteobacteria bacterium MarineAlpha3_Bin5]
MKEIRPSKTNRKKPGSLGELLATIFWAMIIAFSIRTVGYEPFNIPSGSMIPSLLIGDYLFVSKFSYGYSRYSIPFSPPLLPKTRMLFSKPKRGDVIVFKLPSDTSIDYIKRLIGLPGDEIQIQNGILHINGKAVERRKISNFIEEADSGLTRQIPRYIETLPNGKEYFILEESDDLFSDNTQVYRVPKNHYFMMGDNRDRSKDSRFTSVGFIPRENLVGRAEFLFFSINGSFWKFWDWQNTIRKNRLFTGIK